jgi:hypothetical protein
MIMLAVMKTITAELVDAGEKRDKRGRRIARAEERAALLLSTVLSPTICWSAPSIIPLSVVPCRTHAVPVLVCAKREDVKSNTSQPIRPRARSRRDAFMARKAMGRIGLLPLNHRNKMEADLALSAALTLTEV